MLPLGVWANASIAVDKSRKARTPTGSSICASRIKLMIRSPARAQRDRVNSSASILVDEIGLLARQSLKPFTHVSIDSPLSRMPASSLRLGEDSRLIEQESHERSAAALVCARLLPSAMGGPRNGETSRSFSLPMDFARTRFILRDLCR